MDFISIALVLFGWWAFFALPLGRRCVRRTMRIACPAAKAWELIDPEKLQYDWNPHWEMKDFQILESEPLTVEYWARPKGDLGPFEHRVNAYPQVIPQKKLMECICVRNRKEVEEFTFETIDLREEGASASVGIEVVAKIRGLFQYQMVGDSLSLYLKHLRAAAEGRPMRAPSAIRFVGGKILLLAAISTFAVLGWPYIINASNPLLLLFGFIGSIGFLLAILLHEIGHALAFLAFGRRNVIVSFVPFGGGVTTHSRKFDSAYQQGWVAIAGAAFSSLICLLLIPAVAYCFAIPSDISSIDESQRAAFTLALRYDPRTYLSILALAVFGWQAGLNLFNLIPFPGSDGAAFIGALIANRKWRLAVMAACAGVLIFLFFDIQAATTLAVFVAIGMAIRSKQAAPKLDRATTRQRAVLTMVGVATIACLAFQMNFFFKHATSMMPPHLLKSQEDEASAAQDETPTGEDGAQDNQDG